MAALPAPVFGMLSPCSEDSFGCVLSDPRALHRSVPCISSPEEFVEVRHRRNSRRTEDIEMVVLSSVETNDGADQSFELNEDEVDGSEDVFQLIKAFFDSLFGPWGCFSDEHEDLGWELPATNDYA